MPGIWPQAACPLGTRFKLGTFGPPGGASSEVRLARAHSFASTLPTAQAAWALESHRPAPEQGAALELAQLRS